MGPFEKRGPPGAQELTQDQATLASVGLSPSALPESLTAHSAFVKRAICARCGAPKTLPSVTAYLYCDYCGALVDYDFRLANAGTNAGITNTVYRRIVAPCQADMDHAKRTGDRNRYRQIMLYVFEHWIAQCPQAVSPRAKFDPEFRRRMVAYCAEVSVCKDMDPYQQQLDARVNALIAAFQRIPVPGSAWRVAGDFWTMAALWKHQMELAYQAIEATGVAAMDPDDTPSGVALKMEFSTFCQMWIPHLTPADGERLLAEYGMKNDYTKVEPRPTESHRCGACGIELRTLVGARAVVCENCGYKLDIQSPAVPCRNCGAPLSYPVGTGRLHCPYCRCENHRV
jgi:DNA-directed RNA polymerase subunit RPC12/RpoP